MSTDNPHQSPSNPQYPFPPGSGHPHYRPNPMAGMQFPGQHPMHQGMEMGPSSSIPGASGGRGDPGPASLQNQHHGSMPSQFPQGQNQPRPQLNPQQMAMFQRAAQSGYSRQQLEAAMATMQQQQRQPGANVPNTMNPNTMNGIRPMGAGGMGGQGGQGGQGGPPQPMGIDPSQLTMGNTNGGPSIQSQRLHQIMQAQQNGLITAEQARIQAAHVMMPTQNRPPPGSDPSRSSFPGMMPPPALPNTSSPRPPNMPNPHGNQRPPSFIPTPQQQAQIYAHQQNLMNHPQFLALPPPQQQQQLAAMQQGLLNRMAHAQQTQQALAQQASEPPQQQQFNQQPGRPGSAHGMPQQSPVPQRQPTPTLSSLPQHMAPQRPGSAASHRMPSPHPTQPSPRMATATPPPSQPSYPGNAPSPTPSNMSQHSQHHLQHPPRPSMSPSQQSNQYPQNNYMPQGPPAVSVNGNQNQDTAAHQLQMQLQFQQQQQQRQIEQQQLQQQQQREQQHQREQQNLREQQRQQQLQQQEMQRQQQQMQQQQQPPPSNPQSLALQQHVVNAQNLLQAGQLTAPPSAPPASANPSTVSQSHLSSAMGVFNQAAQAQGLQPRPGMVRPPPNIAGIDTSDFPFDFRLLAYFSQMNDPRWTEEMRGKNPQIFAQAQNAHRMVQNQMIRPDILQRMQQCLVQSLKAAGRIAPGTTNLAIAQGARAWNQQGGPNAPRPPPPHVAPSVEPLLQPSTARRVSDIGDKPDSAVGQTSMPPPAWIPPTRTSISAENPIPVKEWETHLRTELPITSITPLPADYEALSPKAAALALPPLSEKEKENVKEWLTKDKDYAQKVPSFKSNMQKKMMNWARNEDMETPWWSLRKGEKLKPPTGRLRIVWPEDKVGDRARMRGRKEFRFSPQQLKSMADVRDHVVPVRLDIEHDQWKLKDTFMWNCADTVVTPELFAHILCDDFRVPHQMFVPKICAAISERIQEYQDQVRPIETSLPEDDGQGKLDIAGDKESISMTEVFKRAREDVVSLSSSTSTATTESLKSEAMDEDDSHIEIVGEDDERPMTVEQAMACIPSGTQEEELRITIKVDIIVGVQALTDTFEWDLTSNVTPEEFAASYVKDLGLSGEFATALSHDIHEQILVHKRSLFLVGHTFGAGLILDDDVRGAFLPPLTIALRREDIAMSSFTPIFNDLSEAEIDRIEKEREKDTKRKKRATRGRRGVILPDREPLKTHRSLLNTGMDPNIVRVPLVPEIAAPQQSSRRAAAIAAQASINLIAQDLAPSQSASPPPSVLVKPRRPKINYNEEETPAETPGRKRSFREDSLADTSPVPRKKNAQGRIIDSPEKDERGQVGGVPGPKLEDVVKRWHCRNCGVPENLAGGVRDGPQGPHTLCSVCSTYIARTGNHRPCEYIEEEMYHRQRLEGIRQQELQSQASSFQSSPAPPPHVLPREAPVHQQASRKRSRTPDSPSSSSSSDSDESFYTNKKKPVIRLRTAPPSATPVPQATSTPTLQSAKIAPSTNSPSQKRAEVKPPTWLTDAHNAMCRKYSKHLFYLVQKPRAAGEESPIEWRIKCSDCPGRIYTPGPNETLDNFEVHLKNRTHLQRVAERDPSLLV